jgi:predicted ATPase
VLFTDAEQQDISIELTYGAQVNRFRFEVPNDRSLNLPVVEQPTVLPTILTGLGDQFTYLNAERLGPRDQQAVTAEEPTKIGVGEYGQYTAQVLALHGSKEVGSILLHPGEHEQDVTTLRTQVERWASDIIRRIRIDAQWLPGINASTIRYQELKAVSEPIRPANMGFGFSYALPVIVAALLMKSGGLFIVENPEAHLHPAGQSRMGRFLARLAANNVQVVVETHSDHVINGIRLAVAESQVLEPDDIGVHFFGDDQEAPELLRMTERGGFDRWPSGFFDQLELDLERLARAKRNHRSS